MKYSVTLLKYPTWRPLFTRENRYFEQWTRTGLESNTKCSGDPRLRAPLVSGLRNIAERTGRLKVTVIVSILEFLLSNLGFSE